VTHQLHQLKKCWFWLSIIYWFRITKKSFKKGTAICSMKKRDAWHMTQYHMTRYMENWEAYINVLKTNDSNKYFTQLLSLISKFSLPNIDKQNNIYFTQIFNRHHTLSSLCILQNSQLFLNLMVYYCFLSLFLNNSHSFNIKISLLSNSQWRVQYHPSIYSLCLFGYYSINHIRITLVIPNVNY
jgi:hypothetical protein